MPAPTDQVKDWLAVVSAAIALGTFAISAGSLRAETRTRNKLATEVSIWKELPSGSPSRASLEDIVTRRAAKLAKLEDPGRRRRRWANIGWGFISAALVAVIAALFWFERGDPGKLVTLLAPVAFKLVVEGYHWFKRRSEKRAGRALAADASTDAPAHDEESSSKESA